MMLPLIIVTLLMRVIDVFRALEVLFIMTFGGPAQATEVLSVKIYKTAFAAQNLGYASTISMLLIAHHLCVEYCVLIYNNPTRQEETIRCTTLTTKQSQQPGRDRPAKSSALSGRRLATMRC